MGYPNTRITDRGALGEIQKYTEDGLDSCIRQLKSSVYNIKKIIMSANVDDDTSEDIEYELGNIGDVIDELEQIKDIFY